MPAGLQVVGTHGVVQVDQNYFNLVLRAKGTVSTGFQQRFDITYTGTTPMVAFRCLNTTIALQYITKSGSTFTYHYISSNPDTITYYIFDRPPTTASNFGLSIWDGSGNLVFSSDYSPMRLVSAVQTPAHQDFFSWDDDAGKPITACFTKLIPGAGTYAACLSYGQQQQEFNSGGDLGDFFEGVKVYSNGVGTFPVFEANFTGSPMEIQPNSGTLMCIDVTGL